jgi:PE family
MTEIFARSPLRCLLSEIMLRHAISGPALRRRSNPMSFVSIVPEILSAAADNLQSIGAGVSARNAVALAPTTGLVPAAADEVSALTAMQFAAHAQMYQAVSAQAAAMHQMFVSVLAASAGSYATVEAANAAAAS